MSADRSDYIRGLRELADRLDANPDCPLPYQGRSVPMQVFAHSDDELRAAARAIGGEKVPDEVHGFSLERAFGELRVSTTPLYGACERVEVGTKKETREVEVCSMCEFPLENDGGGTLYCPSGNPSHDYISPPSTRTVEVEVPVYETRCPESLLKPDQPIPYLPADRAGETYWQDVEAGSIGGAA